MSDIITVELKHPAEDNTLFKIMDALKYEYRRTTKCNYLPSDRVLHTSEIGLALVGIQGVGKTRLMDELRNMLRDRGYIVDQVAEHELTIIQHDIITNIEATKKIKLSAPNDEPDRIVCHNCGCDHFKINVDGLKQGNKLINSVECQNCHDIMFLETEPD